MAKTVRQQLADLVSGKKPNVFYKGLSADTDEHLIGNDVYTSAMNVRINNKQSNLGTVQNISQHVVLSAATFKGVLVKPSVILKDDKFFGNNGDADGLNLLNIIVGFPGTNSIETQTISFSETALFGSSLVHSSNADDYTDAQVIQHIFETLLNTPTFTDVCSVSLFFQGNVKGLLFIPKNQDEIISSVVMNSDFEEIGAVCSTAQINYTAENPLTFSLLSLDSFENGMYGIGFADASIQAVIKFNVHPNGLLISKDIVISANFGIESETSNLITAKSEENENFNRIYWTDGVNPIKVINVSASPEEYQTFDEVTDFNLFSKSPLIPMSVLSVNDGGSINCGAWSYMYRLKTSDGKASSYSPITNPIPIYKSSKLNQYHLILGGLLSDNSGKTVTLEIQNVSDVYDTVELIGIQYLDDSGSAAFFKLKEEAIDGTTISITHTGNENTTVVTAAEILTKQNTWDVAQTIAVKDNRLFAANLKNPTSDIVSDINTFRVKSYKHTTGATGFNFAPAAGGQYATYSNTFVNPNLYDDGLYKQASSDTALFRYAEGNEDTTDLNFGASSDGFHDDNVKNGVYVTFKVKKFSLNNITYWHEFEGNNGNAVDGYCVPPFYKVFPTGEDNSFNNYKNSVFANKFVGYMRDEIYRFGIQFYDKKGNQTFTYPIGDIRFPEIESDLRFVSTIEGNYGVSNLLDGQALPNKYILMDEQGNGYILYPHFKIKLSQSIRDNISGFNIVRAERNDNDKRVVCAGMLHQCLQYAQHSENKGLSDRVGLDKINIFTQDDSETSGDFNFLLSDNVPIYTLDTPEVLFNKLSYSLSGTQHLKICNTYLCKTYTSEDKPTNLGGVIQVNTDAGEDVSWFRDSSNTNLFYAAPFLPSFETEPDPIDLRQNSVFSLYYCSDDTSSPFFNFANIAAQKKVIMYGQNVGTDEVVDASLLTHDKDFRNCTESYSSSNEYNFIDTDGGLIKNNDSKRLNGNKTLMINIKDTEEFKFSSSVLFQGLPRIKNENYFAAKPYVKIIKELTNESGQYGGNSDSVFVNQRWISTGCGLYGSEITNGIMNLDVFGGDTYINILSINKFHYPQYNSDSTKRNGQGVVFPVESTVNVDMRQGSFFGTNNSHLQIQDEYKLTPAYNAQNSIKSFPAKDPKIKSVQNLKNVIAASNIKINGTRSDAFSAFDANENFELNGNYGSINNLKVFRDSMYAFQQKAISVVSINTRALIQSEQGSNIAIQSAVGTGTVIERNDYISTKFGSQHRMNGYVTDLGMYWVDVNNSTICSVSIKNPNYVFDLLEKTNNTSLYSDITHDTVNDNPLDARFSSTAGGISISFNPYYNELIFSISYLTENDTSIKYLSLAYDEDGEIFTSKRSYSSYVSCIHNNLLFSTGYEHLTTGTMLDDKRSDIFYEDVDTDEGGNSGEQFGEGKYNLFYGNDNSVKPHIEFVCNEEVGSLKTFDKVTLLTQQNVLNGIFTKFVYKTNIDTLEETFITQGFAKTLGGKHIVPITTNETGDVATKRFKGNYIKIKIEQVSNAVEQKFDLFSATTYYRKQIV
jgi:hypothetical protein